MSDLKGQLFQAVREYRMPPSAQTLLTANLPLVITGVTAAGKNAVTEFIVANSPYRQVITHTTRQPRDGEEHAKDYHFISEDEMLGQMAAAAFVEVQTVHGEAVYGISLAAYRQVLETGNKPLLVIDVQGVEEISRYVTKLRPVFLLPPSFEEWMSMMDKRGHMSHAERLRRLHSARNELDKVTRSRLFNLVVNRDVPRTAKEILDDIHDGAEQHRNLEIAQLLIDRLKTI